MSAIEQLNNTLTLKLTKEIIFLFYISIRYKIDLETLLLIYQELKEKIVLPFFLFEGKKVAFPTIKKMIKMAEVAELLQNDLLENTENAIGFKNLPEIRQELLKIYNPENGTITIKLNIENVRDIQLFDKKGKKVRREA